MFVMGKLAIGGSERVLSILASQLAEMGHEVIVLIYNAMPNEYSLDDRVHKYYMPEINYSYSFLWKRNKKTLFQCLKYIRNIVKLEKPDYLLPFYYSEQRDLMVSTLFMKKKIIAVIRNNPAQFPWKRLTRWYRNIMCLFSYKIYVQNNVQKNYFPNFMKKKTFVLANPVSDEFLKSKKEEYFSKNSVQFVSIGRLVQQKNHKNMLDAFKIVLEKYPRTQLKIFGDDQLRENIEKYICDLKIEDSVQCMGRTQNVVSALMESDIFILSSDFEGMPNALMEALTLGMPCVSTDCPTGPADLIKHGVSGLLVPIKNPIKLAESMLYMIEHQEEAAQMGKNAREYMVHNYNSQQITENLCKFLRGQNII